MNTRSRPDLRSAACDSSGMSSRRLRVLALLPFGERALDRERMTRVGAVVKLHFIEPPFAEKFGGQRRQIIGRGNDEHVLLFFL